MSQQYDIRIWHELYSTAIKQAKSEAKKEQMKRKLYAATESEPQDEDISLDVIKRRVARKRMIHRRYREFMELHNRLTGGKLAVHMKGEHSTTNAIFVFLYKRVS